MPAGATIAVTVTGNGLKDTETALSRRDLEPTVLPVDLAAVVEAIGL